MIKLIEIQYYLHSAQLHIHPRRNSLDLSIMAQDFNIDSTKPLKTQIDQQIHEYQYFKYFQLGASSPKLEMPTRGRVAPRLACVRGATLRQIAVYFCHNNNFPPHFITEPIISLIQFTTTLLTNALRYPHHHTQTYAPISRTSRPQTMDAQR